MRAIYDVLGKAKLISSRKSAPSRHSRSAFKVKLAVIADDCVAESPVGDQIRVERNTNEDLGELHKQRLGGAEHCDDWPKRPK